MDFFSNTVSFFILICSPFLVLSATKYNVWCKISSTAKVVKIIASKIAQLLLTKMAVVMHDQRRCQDTGTIWKTPIRIAEMFASLAVSSRLADDHSIRETVIYFLYPKINLLCQRCQCVSDSKSYIHIEFKEKKNGIETFIRTLLLF